MNAYDYEQFVAELARQLVSRLNRDASAKVGCGGSNKTAGASGFEHQIDVSVCTPYRMLLIECKYWNGKIDPEATLAFAARVLDIRAAHEGREVTGRIVTTHRVTPGVCQIADYFDLGVDIVSSTQEYAIQIWNYVGIGLTERAIAIDEFIVNVLKSSNRTETVRNRHIRGE